MIEYINGEQKRNYLGGKEDGDYEDINIDNYILKFDDWLLIYIYYELIRKIIIL